MSTQRALKRSRVRRSGSPAPAPGLPSLHQGMQGLNHLAGNAAMAALVARRPAKEAYRLKELELDEESEGEEEVAALRLTLDEFDKLMRHLDKARDRGRGAYPDLRAWILELVERLHAALGATHGADADLEKELARLERLSPEPGKHRLEVLTQLAQKLQANAERIFGELSRQLPGAGPGGGTAPDELVRECRRELAQALKDAQADVRPGGARKRRRSKAR